MIELATEFLHNNPHLNQSGEAREILETVITDLRALESLIETKLDKTALSHDTNGVPFIQQVVWTAQPVAETPTEDAKPSAT